MSAYLVSFAHINVLLSFVRHHRFTLPHPEGRDTCADLTSVDTATNFGRALLRENLRSLNARYGTKHGFADHLGGEDSLLAAYRFTTDPRFATAKPSPALAVIKATFCYDYQACESDDYEATWAADIMRRIRDAACRELPGYSDAPWGFNDRDA